MLAARGTPITCAFAGPAGLAYVAMGFSVVNARVKSNTIMGEGSDAETQSRIRMHGNFGENVPLALLLLSLAESNELLPAWALWGLGGAFFTGRALHALGFMLQPVGLKDTSKVAAHMNYRKPGMLLTWGSMAVLGAAIAVKTFTGL